MFTPPSMASCAQWTHMMHQRWLCPRIPVPVLTLSDYYTNSLITRGQLLLLRFKHLFYSVFPQLFLGGILFLFRPHAYPSPLCALPPPSLPLTTPVPSHSPHSWGEWVESSMGMQDPRRAEGALPHTNQSTGCVQTPTDRPVGSFGG